jgi:multiple antibiotic resistance protein
VFDHLFHAVLLLFVAVDPIGLAAIFAGLTHGESAHYRRQMALRGTGLAALVLVVFALFGDGLLAVLRISLPAFRIAGGALLFLLAIDMVFARHSGVRAPTEREQAEAEHRKDISVFPLAIPLIAGPGAITTVLLMSGTGRGSLLMTGALLAVLAVVLATTLASLLAAGRIMRVIGETGANVVGRVFGIVLAALAVQFVLDGLQAALAPAPAAVVLPTAL